METTDVDLFTTIHLVERGLQDSVLCGPAIREVATAGAWFEHWRRDPRCCAACLALTVIYARPLRWYDALGRLRRRQHAIRIRRQAHGR